MTKAGPAPPGLRGRGQQGEAMAPPAAAREGGPGLAGPAPPRPRPAQEGRSRLLPLPGVGLEERLGSPCRGHGGVLRVPLLGFKSFDTHR